ncbi:hypothetical protein HDU67_008309 [Dinochytrium kinnereticum]|nr:hypothetical protein HDU67_008309 [Dinochytrium kinnereticum]
MNDASAARDCVGDSKVGDSTHDMDIAPTCREEALARGRKYMDATVSVHEMPAWYHDGTYILTGYRRIQFTYYGCIRSLFYIHNETGNVYTHMMGVILFLILVGVSFGPSPSSSSPLGALGTVNASLPSTSVTLPTTTAAGPTATGSPVAVNSFGPSSSAFTALMPTLSNTTALDVIVVSIFLMSAIFCLGLSTTYHLCCCHSHEVAKAWNKADYVGIVFLIVGSFIPSLFYGFYCSKSLQLTYIIAITLLGTATAIVTMSTRFSTPKYRYLRTILFAALGLSGIVPLVHALILYRPEFADEAMGLRYVGGMGAMYIMGAVLYASRIPERWFPGKFDIWFHSHQLFHVLVVGAAVTHYIGLTKAYWFWHAGVDRCSAL